MDKNKKKSNKMWILFSLLAALGYGLANFTIYTLQRDQGQFNVIPLMLIYFIFISIIATIIYFLIKKGKIKNKILNNYDKDIEKIFTNKKYLSLMILTTVLLVFSTMCIYGSYNVAPNPGICDVISSFSNIFLMILLFIFFKTKIHLVNALGVGLMIVAGYFILS
tara:strand:+ start:1200 stop:1694 length:495 start_codon:yes stop_codon:yes gene_type:complete